MNKCEYFYTYTANVKLRWKNKSIIDVLEHEFASRNREYYLGALEAGVITVNNKITCPSHKLQDHDIIRHVVHAHEPEQPNIEIISKEDDFIVVHKPAGIPCHPVGAYHNYSVTETLFPDQKVGCVNRLDMPVSGVLILTLNNRAKNHDSLLDATKIYIAKVKGDFPDEITVDQPIGEVGTKILNVTSNGKPSVTIFKKLKFSNGYSLVQCQPITGRTHQIRIHLKYLGFPIVNDILYGDGKELIENPLYDCKATFEEYLSDFSEENEKNIKKYEFIVKNCKGSQNRTFLIKDSFICLHAWKYTFSNKTFEAKWPEWANFE